MTEELVHGWKAAAAVVGVSERYVRQMAADRNLVAGRRADGAVALRRADLEALGAELRQDGRDISLAARGTGAAQGALESAAPYARSSEIPGTTAVATSPTALTAAVSAAEPSTVHRGAHAPSAPADVTSSGETAAIVFADLAAGRTLREIVVNRRVSPEVVRRHHGEWTALEAVDGLRTPSAEARMAGLETALAKQQVALEQQAAAVAEVAGLRAALNGLGQRFGAIEQRLSGDRTASTVSALGQRLDAVEQQLRTMPMAPVATAQRCGRCGRAHLTVFAACGVCGLGVGPPS